MQKEKNRKIIVKGVKLAVIAVIISSILTIAEAILHLASVAWEE